MSCYICGGPISEPMIDVRDNKMRPCSTCEHIIQESLEELENRDENGSPVTSLTSDLSDFYQELHAPEGKRSLGPTEY